MRGFKSLGVASLALLPSVLAVDILKTNGFTECSDNPTITVQNMDVSFDRSSNKVTFNVAGESSQSQEVTASLIVTAYGKNVYQKDFDPCASDTKVDQLCPVPAGHFSAQGSQSVPSSFVDQIPSIAFSIPDLDGNAKIELKAKDGGKVLACIDSSVNNGKSVQVPAVSYIAAGIAGAALALSALGALAHGGSPGASSSSPGFGEVIFWFQGMAMNGMHSVNYPPIYRNFAKNFAFSTGLVSWGGLQENIDSFRGRTGGNLTVNSYKVLDNATLSFDGGAKANTTTHVTKRSSTFDLIVRQISTSVNGSDSSSSSSNSTSKLSRQVSGIQAFTEQLTIPETNTFMTVLLVFAIAIASIVLGILLFKVILEAWYLFSKKFPKSLRTFRADYWAVMARTITNLILLLYGVWTLYCIFQFTHGDSWAAKLLAALTLSLFTAILVFYTWRIWALSRRYTKSNGDNSALYEDKALWRRYKLFYAEFRRGYWWLFVPAIAYMFAKGCVLASADGHGLVQTIGQLVIEALMLGLLLWTRPYNRKSGNWINVVIQVVRVLSVVCILLFVEELGISQTTKTITGVVLIGVQSGLTVILAILIAVNSIIVCVRENPHRKRRKAAEKMAHMRNQSSADMDMDDLTPMNNNGNMNTFDPTVPQEYKGAAPSRKPVASPYMNQGAYEPTRDGPPRYADDEERLVGGAAGTGSRSHSDFGHAHTRGSSQGSRDLDRQPTLPQVEPRWRT